MIRMKRKFTLLMTLVVVLAISAFIIVQGQEAAEVSECYTNCCASYLTEYVPQNTSPRLVLDRFGNLTPENGHFVRGVGNMFMEHTEKIEGATVLCYTGVLVDDLVSILNGNHESIYASDLDGYMPFDPLFASCCDNMQRAWRFSGYFPLRDGNFNLIG